MPISLQWHPHSRQPRPHLPGIAYQGSVALRGNPISNSRGVLSGNWIFHDLPTPVLLSQRAWDKRHRLRIAHLCGGVSMDELGRKLGVSQTRIHQQITKAAMEALRGTKCPAEKYVMIVAAGAIDKLAKLQATN